MRPLYASFLLLVLLGAGMLSCSHDRPGESIAGNPETLATGGLTPVAEEIQNLGPAGEEDLPSRRPKAAGVETFPNTLGSFWEYAVTDTVTGATSTVTVTITDTLNLYGSIPVAVWVYERDDVFEKVEFVNITGHTVAVYPDDPFALVIQPIRKLVFPIEVGNVWDHMFGRDAEYYAVPEAGSITVPAGEFDSYHVIANHRSGMLDLVDISALYFAPNVGYAQVERTIGWRQTISSREIWQLVQFSVTE
jgi:hypothetical protein